MVSEVLAELKLCLSPADLNFGEWGVVNSQPAREILDRLDEFHSSATPMWVFDQHSLAFLEVNDAATRQYGYSRQQFLKMTILDIRPHADVPKLLHSALHPHATFGDIWRHRKKDGTVFEVRIVSRLVIFLGHDAELVSAQEVAATSTEQETSTKTQAESSTSYFPVGHYPTTTAK